ncbi:hypothetical protein B0T17DRAFT_258052 [Bombardia bombarda]|uniref:Uncharacterized protein n=1 Tax=Bombardia bombarda TaxID=252184 RepID=A0AA39X0E4_9PEZI|nr:hypothetical protein B0T17DRAFT_258052 [Bombardia bombarda]
MEPPHRALGRPSSIVESFLRPSTPRPSKARRASPGPSVDQARAQKLSEQYIRDAKEEKARQLNAGVRLHEAVKKADSSKLSELLQANLDLDARDGEGRTALHVAANLGRCEQLDLLLEHKDVDINALDLQKNTPLHLATLSKKRESVEHLLKRGANTEIADKKGHLPKYYALTVPQIKSLFDNPPKVLKKRGKTPEHPENNRFLIPEVILTTRPPVPEGIQLRLSENFRGSLWEPNSDVRWSSVSIWNLIYCQDEVFQNRRAASKKWVHLSATSEMWTKDLVRSLCAARGVTRDRYREMRDFVSRVFKDVDVDGPERKRHFQRQTSSEKRMAEDEMYAIVLPIVDVDKRDYLELARNHHIEVLNGKIEEDVLTDALTFSSVTSDPSQAEHLTRMLQLSNFLGHMQPLPRSLDQSYHEYLDIDKIALLDSDQVMTRYIRHLKVKSLEVIKKSSERRAPEMQHSHFPAMGGANLHDLMAGGMPTSIPPISPPPPTTSPIPPAERGRALNKDDENTNNIQLETIMSEGNLPGGKDYPGADHPLPIESVANTLTANQREAPGPPSPTLSSLKHEDELDEIDHDETKTPFEPDDLITVPHFWLFKLDAGASHPVCSCCKTEKEKQHPTRTDN